MTAAALRARRLPLLALGAASLVVGVLAGLARMGWALPLPHDGAALLHGPLMVSGFFGTVIGLERAAALGRWPVFAGPLASGAGGILLVTGGPEAAGAALLTLAAAILLAASLWVWRQQPAGFTATMAGGAACWLVGNGLWLAGWPATAAVTWWMLFLVLTIAGERLELSRFRPPDRRAAPAFAVTVAALVAGAVLATVAPDAGLRLTGVGLAALALWLVRFDVARQTVRMPGLPRFVALCLLSGYGGLLAGGLIALASAAPATGPLYDAVLHAVMLGFVFAMVFGHAPIILPAVLRLAVPFGRRLYLPLVALHLGVAMRTAGVLADDLMLRQWGGAANAAAIGLFIVLTAWSVVRGR
ncbi:hypothetical protein [Azospirillum halopraeferens]|uniref:hypothetical protein n=1 Tax=Azospirillum halopraeferens TaxID=34010 RepID=UPI00040FB230|nr:hypothetical protein [Azospirillum halopraeferens]